MQRVICGCFLMNKRCNHTSVKTYLKPLLERLNITYKTLYATRHSFASSVVENNMPITLAQKYLGHTKLSTTMDYYVKNGLIDIAKIDSWSKTRSSAGTISIFQTYLPKKKTLAKKQKSSLLWKTDP